MSPGLALGTASAAVFPWAVPPPVPWASARFHSFTLRRVWAITAAVSARPMVSQALLDKAVAAHRHVDGPAEEADKVHER